LRNRIANSTDNRLRLVNMVLSGIILIKMSTWELPFINLIGKVRADEIGIIRKKALLHGFLNTLLQATPKLALFATLLVYILQGNALDAETVRHNIHFANVQILFRPIVYNNS